MFPVSQRRSITFFEFHALRFVAIHGEVDSSVNFVSVHEKVKTVQKILKKYDVKRFFTWMIQAVFQIVAS